MSGNGWRISFQRKLGEGPSANRGALPFLVQTGAARCLVPLPDGENVWIAVQCSRDVTVSAQTSQGEPVRHVIVASTEGDRLVALDAVYRKESWTAIGASAIRRRTADVPGEPHIMLQITRDVPIAEFEIEFVTPGYYTSFTGRNIPPTTERDGFQGHRLP